MRSVAVSVLVVVIACSNGDDGPSGPVACTGALYDPCETEHDCMSNQCQNFVDGLLVCSQACTPGDNATCPEMATCTVDGVCKPARANDCER